MLCRILSLEGHEASEARDAAIALTVAESTRPHVALIDIGLPDFDGYELARRMRARLSDPRPVLIALTGYGQAEDRSRALEAGFDVHLTKPVAPELLARAMGAVPA
jgi:DNA-binding response OmpR family regulator